MRSASLIVALLLAGCLGGAPPEAPAGSERPPSTCPREADCVASPQGPASGPIDLAAPDLPVGRAFTFRGEEVYNPDKEFTIVVARADEAGYLFAGGAEDDVAFAAAWGSSWFGEIGRDLNRADTESRYFQWPLVDGATWEIRDGFTARASAADVPAPGGAVPGFVVEATSERSHFRYTYAPSVGFFTTWVYEAQGRSMERLELTRVGDARDYVWFEGGAPVHAHDPADPQTLEVAAGGADAVVVSAGGAGGGRVTVARPESEPYSKDFPARTEDFEGTWDLQILPPEAGTWVATTQASPRAPADLPVEAPLGWAYVVLAPVKWVKASVG